MGFALTTPTTKSKANDNWGMGFLLVFFPEDHNHHENTTTNTITNKNNKNTSIIEKYNPLFSSSFRKTNSSLLFTKAQSTISICALFVFLTLLLFTLSTFEPTINSPISIRTPRRFLSQKSPPSISHHNQSPVFSFLRMWSNEKSSYGYKHVNDFALQGMGTLYRRGTRAVSDLVVAHVSEDVKDDEFRLFLRLLHRSGLTAKADIAFLFTSSSSLSKFGFIVREENESFFKLIQHYMELNGTRSTTKNSVLNFDVNQFFKPGKKELGEPLWGKKSRGNYGNSTEDADDESESTRLHYGSIVGFDVTELDPENSLAGFLDNMPMSLRRWACYPMLLGRVKRNFKHIALVDMKNVVFVGDPLSRVRKQGPESVHISMRQDKHTKRNSDKTQSHHQQASSAVIMGGARGVRRLSNAMLTEIVRATMQHKRKNSPTESGVLSQLVGNGHILKNVNLVMTTESFPETSSLTGSNSEPSSVGCGLMHRGNDAVVDSIIMKQICSCEEDSSVYKNC